MEHQMEFSIYKRHQTIDSSKFKTVQPKHLAADNSIHRDCRNRETRNIKKEQKITRSSFSKSDNKEEDSVIQKTRVDKSLKASLHSRTNNHISKNINHGKSRVYNCLFFAGFTQRRILFIVFYFCFLPKNKFLFVEDNSFPGNQTKSIYLANKKLL